MASNPKERMMRTVRAGIALAVVAGVLAAPLAQAARPRPVCDLVTDSAGDVIATAPGVDNGDYDIRSADVATDGRQLTAVIRLTSLAPEDPASAVARDYEIDFTANGKTFGLMASLLTGGADFEAVALDTSKPGGNIGTDLGRITGVVDTTRHEIRMTAKLAIFAPYASFHQTYLSDFSVTSARAVGHTDETAPGGKATVGSQSTAVVVDDAGSKARYTPGARSCVRVGS
jgi:hypothetical protein